MERFADSLRAINPNDEKMRIMNAKFQKTVSWYLGMLKNACTGANSSNKRSISCFCVAWQDEGYSQNGTIAQLPTVQEYIKRAEEFNKQKFTTYSTYRSASTGQFETRLYEDLIKYKPEELDYAKELQRALNVEISKMGFTSFKVSLVELDDIYIVHNRTKNLFSAVVKESISTRVAGKIYAFRFQASW